MLFGIKENEPVPGMAVTLLPQKQLNPIWLWQGVFFGKIDLPEEEGGEQETPKDR